MEKRRGHYLGTEIDSTWWKRYTKEGFLARGNGEYWFDDEAFYFRRFLTEEPLVIPFDEVHDLKFGTWHAGRWALGRPIVKLLWQHEGQSLNSGFDLDVDEAELQQIVTELEQRI